LFSNFFKNDFKISQVFLVMCDTIPKLWIQSLDLETDWLEGLLKQDDITMKSFNIATYAIRNGKYKNDKRKQRLKLQAVKNQFFDCYLINFLKRKSVVIGLIVKGVEEYWKNQPNGEASDYDKLMKELDEILSTPLEYDTTVDTKNKGESKEFQVELYQQERTRGCTRRCRDIAYGFCFCVNENNEFY
jgi:hypothetical protein